MNRKPIKLVTIGLIFVTAIFALSTAPTLEAAISPETATTIITIDQNVAVGRTSIALNSSSFPVISYSDDNNQTIKLAVCYDDLCANKSVQTVVDSGVGWEKFAMVLNSSGFPVISYHDTTLPALRLVTCNDPACASKEIHTVDEGSDVGRFASLALNSSGNPVISYYAGGALKLAICGDTTCANPAAKTINFVDTIGDAGRHNSLALNSSGFPVISYYVGSNDTVKLAICDDETCSNPDSKTIGTASFVSSTSLVLDDNDRPIISFLNSFLSTAMYFAQCDDAICANPDVNIIEGAHDIKQGTLALDNRGLPIISYSYLKTISDDPYTLSLIYCGNVSCFYPTIYRITTPPSAGGTSSSMILNSSDTPIFAYADDASSGSLKLAICRTCSGQFNKYFGGTAFTSDITRGPNGLPVISSIRRGGTIDYIACQDMACKKHTATYDIGSAGSGSQYNSMVFNETFGIVQFSYYDAANLELKLVSCYNAACTSKDVLTVDNDDVGQYNSLAITSAGNPVISYYDAVIDDLALAICSDPICYNTPTLIRIASPYGTHTSLALDANDNPVVSFYDSLNDELKLLVCENPTCTSRTIKKIDDGGLGNSLALTGNGKPIISYISADQAKLAYCLDASCTSVYTIKVLNDTQSWDTALALYNDIPVVTFSNGGDIEVIICREPSCNDNPLTTILDTDNQGRFALLLDDNGLPIISHLNLSTEFLEVTAFNAPAQAIALDAGWNMISSYLYPQYTYLADLLVGIEGSFLVKNSQGEIYWPDFGIDQIGQWQPGEGYLVHVDIPQMLPISGTAIFPNYTPIELQTGWQMIAYHREQALPVDQALASIAGQLIIAKDDAGHVYWPGENINTIGELQPGEGYQVNLSANATLTYPD